MHLRCCSSFVKAFIITTCSWIYLSSCTQSHTENLFTGMGHFQLGDPQSKFGDSLTLAMDSQYVHMEDPASWPYPYYYKGTRPDFLDRTIAPLQDFLAFFDEKQTLVMLDLTNLYGIDHDHLPVSTGLRYYKQLLGYFTERLKQPGKKVQSGRASREMVAETYEWKAPMATLTVESQYNTTAKSLAISVYLKKK